MSVGENRGAKGPLAGYRIVEFASVGPAPYCGMLLADMGADVIKIDRLSDVDLGVHRDPRFNLLNRGKRSITIDLKCAEGAAVALRLVRHADVLIEGFRPGVMERLGIGPDVCSRFNPRLVYGRITGWGQEGPNHKAAGHDINFIALTGALNAIGQKGGPPVPALNLIGDFGGGGMFLAFGIVAALLERNASGLGQVIDSAMVDGAASLMTYIFGLHAAGRWSDERGSNPTDGGAPFYGVYETADGKYVALGAIESRFFRNALKLAGLDALIGDRQWDTANWELMKAQIAGVIRQKTRHEWCEIMESDDTCFSPVLSLSEAPFHRHNVARETFIEIDGTIQPAPAPRFSRSHPSRSRKGPPHPGEHTLEILREDMFGSDEIAALRARNVIGS